MMNKCKPTGPPSKVIAAPEKPPGKKPGKKPKGPKKPRPSKGPRPSKAPKVCSTVVPTDCGMCKGLKGKVSFLTKFQELECDFSANDHISKHAKLSALYHPYVRLIRLLAKNAKPCPRVAG